MLSSRGTAWQVSAAPVPLQRIWTNTNTSFAPKFGLYLIAATLQKYRVLIVASFAKLISILASLTSDKDLQEWNHYAQVLLTQISETRFNARVNQKRYDGTNSKLVRSAFDFFGVPEEEVERMLEAVY
jgi:hypothetical protein